MSVGSVGATVSLPAALITRAMIAPAKSVKWRVFDFLGVRRESEEIEIELDLASEFWRIAANAS
jgi:hypothetical protein